MSDLIKHSRDAMSLVNRESTGTAVPYNPAREIENSLVGLLKHQIEKLKDSEVYINAFQEAILGRLAEANFMELVDALSRAQASKNSLMEKILSPVIPKAGSTAPLLETPKHDPSETVSNQANKETLQALTELANVIKDIKKESSDKSESTDADDIKKQLNL